jgi:hypothetical protein
VNGDNGREQKRGKTGQEVAHGGFPIMETNDLPRRFAGKRTMQLVSTCATTATSYLPRTRKVPFRRVLEGGL